MSPPPQLLNREVSFQQGPQPWQIQIDRPEAAKRISDFAIRVISNIAIPVWDAHPSSRGIEKLRGAASFRSLAYTHQQETLGMRVKSVAIELEIRMDDRLPI
jgi:hypothetical protein